MKTLSRRDFLQSLLAVIGLSALKPVIGPASTKREAISDIRWYWDDCGVYWSAKWLIDDGKQKGIIGNYYCVNDDMLRDDVLEQEHDMRERYELLDGETGIRTLDELPAGSILDLPDMDDFLVLNEYPDGKITTTYYAGEMWEKVRVIAPGGEQWRTVNWDGEQGNLWVRC